MADRLEPKLPPPATVTDLTVTAVADTTATLTWTEVASGVAGVSAAYALRHGPASGFAWWLLSDEARGSCAAPIAGQGVGIKRSCLVIGLTPSTAYSFQVVAFTGTLNSNAVFGNVSNVTTATTVATPPVVPPPAPPPPPPPPPPPSVTVTAVAVLPLGLNLTVGDSGRLFGVIGRSDGSVSPTTRGLQWTSSVPRVASVVTGTLNGNGIVVALDTGLTRVMALDSASGVNGYANIVVRSPAVLPTVLQASILSRLGLPLIAGTYGSWLVVDSVGHSVAHVSVTVTVLPLVEAAPELVAVSV